MKPTPPVLWFKAASPLRAPSPWWYWGRAVYVSRRDYRRIFLVFLAVGVPLGGAGVLCGSATLLRLALSLAALGLALLTYSLVGLYRMYGHPSVRYYRRLFREAGLRDGMRLADLHIGTYRTTFALASLHPTAHVTSVDCWDVDGPPAEPAVADVRDAGCAFTDPVAATGEEGVGVLELEHLRAPGRCPAGRGMVSVYFVDAARFRCLEPDDDALIDKARRVLARVHPESAGAIELAHVIRWPVGIAQFRPGRFAEIAALRERLAASSTNVDLAGDWLDGVASESALRTGEQAAARVVRSLAA